MESEDSFVSGKFSAGVRDPVFASVGGGLVG